MSKCLVSGFRLFKKACCLSLFFFFAEKSEHSLSEDELPVRKATTTTTMPLSFVLYSYAIPTRLHHTRTTEGIFELYDCVLQVLFRIYGMIPHSAV